MKRFESLQKAFSFVHFFFRAGFSYASSYAGSPPVEHRVQGPENHIRVRAGRLDWQETASQHAGPVLGMNRTPTATSCQSYAKPSFGFWVWTASTFSPRIRRAFYSAATVALACVRYTNTINLADGGVSMRPTVINCYQVLRTSNLTDYGTSELFTCSSQSISQSPYFLYFKLNIFALPNATPSIFRSIFHTSSVWLLCMCAWRVYCVLLTFCLPCQRIHPYTGRPRLHCEMVDGLAGLHVRLLGGRKSAQGRRGRNQSGIRLYKSTRIY